MKRVLTALALIPIVVYVVLWANLWIFLAVLFAVAFLCYREYDAIAAAYGFGAPGLAARPRATCSSPGAAMPGST